MRPGEGGANAVFDIFVSDLSTDGIRARWKAGDYGAEGERPRPDMMKGWFALAGRK